MRNFAPVASTLLLLIFGLTIGYFAGRSVSAAEEPPPTAVEVEALHELTRALDTLTAQTGRLPAAESGAPGDGWTLDAGSIHALELSVREASGHLESIARSLLRMQDATNPLSVPGEPIGDEVFAGLREASDVERRIGVHGWSHRQVVQTYGVPSRIVPEREGASERWYYKRPDLGEFIFQFNGDRLVEVIVP